ncbi:response regulator transcription factor [bacterium]|jgi:DNA-binding response OmpR family regulator|nr:response regulator transcription factor [Verrucomicrobiota bacterium]MDA7633555.1 response regulator transcription factor [bacterium]
MTPPESHSENQEHELPRERILLIDDDVEFCQLLGEYLESVGYETDAVHRGPAGIEKIHNEQWQAAILDVMMPGMDGFEVLKEVRKTSSLPILMLTARGDEMDVVVGLEVGADDYVLKTSSMRQLLARLRAVCRRSTSLQLPESDFEPDQKIGELIISPSKRECQLEGIVVELTPVEFDVLNALAMASGRVKSRDALLSDIRDRDYEVFDRSIDMHISALRRKLGDDPKQPRFIRTFRSAGYMLIDPSQE